MMRWLSPNSGLARRSNVENNTCVCGINHLSDKDSNVENEYDWGFIDDIDAPPDNYFQTLDAPVRVTSETGGEKDQKPLQLHAIPWEALSELGRVYAFGAGKYENYNFRKGYDWSLTYDAMQRHMGAFWNREDNDEESGLHHLAHAVWHGFTLLFFSLTERGKDDRPE